jgi:hypothetical protein
VSPSTSVSSTLFVNTIRLTATVTQNDWLTTLTKVNRFSDERVISGSRLGDFKMPLELVVFEIVAVGYFTTIRLLEVRTT